MLKDIPIYTAVMVVLPFALFIFLFILMYDLLNKLSREEDPSMAYIKRQSTYYES